MPRRRRIPLVKGKKRVRYKKGMSPEIVRTYFCGECGRRTKISSGQRSAEIAKRENLKRYIELARYCDNIEEHKEGEIYFWPMKNVRIPIY